MQIDSLSWFPGHMTKTKRMVAQEMGHMDAVCEILDARIPLSSRNPDVDELAAGKVSCFVVTRRGKPVAEIIPPRSNSSGLKFGLEKGKWSLDDKAFKAADAAVAEMFA